jgi:hypothetical protein
MLAFPWLTSPSHTLYQTNLKAMLTLTQSEVLGSHGRHHVIKALGSGCVLLSPSCPLCSHYTGSPMLLRHTATFCLRVFALAIPSISNFFLPILTWLTQLLHLCLSVTFFMKSTLGSPGIPESPLISSSI